MSDDKILCKVNGVVEKGAMCGDIKVGGEECSLEIGCCKHQSLDNKNNVTEITPNKTLHALGLHEQLEMQAEGMFIMRVPGGWIYNQIESFEGQAMSLPPVFVPYNDEFKALN